MIRFHRSFSASTTSSPMCLIKAALIVSLWRCQRSRLQVRIHIICKEHPIDKLIRRNLSCLRNEIAYVQWFPVFFVHPQKPHPTHTTCINASYPVFLVIIFWYAKLPYRSCRSIGITTMKPSSTLCIVHYVAIYQACQ